MDAKPRLLDAVRERLRARHYSYRTEQQYVAWIRRYVLFHGKRHPAGLAAAEIEQFLTHLAVERNVSASTQNQALSALLFLYREVLGVQLPWLDNVVRARRPAKLPVVLSPAEVRSLLRNLHGQYALLAGLMYGSGLRLLESLRLRVKDIDFGYSQVIVRDGKGAKDRVTVLPDNLAAPLTAHLERVRERHAVAIARHFAGVELPHALACKYPAATLEWGGSMSFRPSGRLAILWAVAGGGITSTNRACSAPCGRRHVAPASRSLSGPIRCVAALQHTCWSEATTSARCRSSSATPTSEQRRSIRTS
jgi:integron integrase